MAHVLHAMCPAFGSRKSIEDIASKDLWRGLQQASRRGVAVRPRTHELEVSYSRDRTSSKSKRDLPLPTELQRKGERAWDTPPVSDAVPLETLSCLWQVVDLPQSPASARADVCVSGGNSSEELQVNCDAEEFEADDVEVAFLTGLLQDPASRCPSKSSRAASSMIGTLPTQARRTTTPELTMDPCVAPVVPVVDMIPQHQPSDTLWLHPAFTMPACQVRWDSKETGHGRLSVMRSEFSSKLCQEHHAEGHRDRRGSCGQSSPTRLTPASHTLLYRKQRTGRSSSTPQRTSSPQSPASQRNTSRSFGVQTWSPSLFRGSSDLLLKDTLATKRPASLESPGCVPKPAWTNRVEMNPRFRYACRRRSDGGRLPVGA